MIKTEALRQTPLFSHMNDEEILAVLKFLCAREKKYRKGELVYRAGERTDFMGLVLSGSVTIEMTDYLGNRTILSRVGPGHSFAETYAMIPDSLLPVDVAASEDADIGFFQVGKLFSGKCPAGAPTERLIRNLLQISMRKNVLLSARSFHTSPKTIRGKVLAYLHTISLEQHSQTIDIPLDRQQLADYLCLDRTALSKELGRMKRDGIIDFWKNHFKLL